MDLIASRPQEARRSAVEKNIVIVPNIYSSETKSDTCQFLEKSLRAKGFETVETCLNDLVNIDLRDRDCIATLEIDNPILGRLDEQKLEAIMHMAMTSRSTLWISDGCHLTGRNPEGGIIKGLGRTVRAERHDACFGILQVESRSLLSTEDFCDAVDRILASFPVESPQDTADWEFILSGRRIYVERIVPHPPLQRGLGDLDNITSSETTFSRLKEPGKGLEMCLGTKGLLDKFRFRHDNSHCEPLSDYSIEIEVKATSINYRDVLVATGQLELNEMGIYCSGKVIRAGPKVDGIEPGDRVYGIHLGCFKTYVIVDARNFLQIPPGMTYEEAATVVSAHVSAAYAIMHIARLQSGEKILIHSAAGSTGQAAVQISKHIGAEIFTTVLSEAKVDFLVAEYGLKKTQIFNSRNLSFKDGIQRLTLGRGVDVVLNSLAGEALRQSWLCVAPFGRFVELGKREISENVGLEMGHFANDTLFAAVDMLNPVDRIQRNQKALRTVSDLLEQGAIRPVPFRIYDFGEASEAFRCLQSGKHIGKFILRPNLEENVPIQIKSLQSYILPQNATYLLIGGLGGLGRVIAKDLSNMGAHRLIFLSRSKTTDSSSRFLSNLKQRGTDAEIIVCDASCAEGFAIVLQSVKKRFPAIRGVIHCEMDLRDGVFETMNAESWNTSLLPKVHVSKILNNVFPEHLDCFILLSSITGVIGSRGQASCNAGNAYQDALAHCRRYSGRRATSINLSLVIGAGVSTQHPDTWQLVLKNGLIGMIEQDALMLVRAAIVDQLPVQSILGLASGLQLRTNQVCTLYWFRDARFAAIQKMNAGDAQQGHGIIRQDSGKLLTGIQFVQGAIPVILAEIMQKLSQMTGISMENLDSGKPIHFYGVDSL